MSHGLRGLAWLHYFSVFMLIKDRPLLWMVARSQTSYPEHILAYGSGKARCALIVDYGSFRTDWLDAGNGGGLSTILRLGL